MSQTSATASGSSSNFQSIFDNALKQYKNKTKKDLLAHRLTTQLQNCDSPTAILAVLDEQYNLTQFIQSEDSRPKQWLNATVNVLFAFSGVVGTGVGLVFSPAGVIFAGVGVLLQAAMDVGASQAALVGLLDRIESFFKRLEIYIEVPLTGAMTDLIVKIMIEVLGVLAIATKNIKQGIAKKYLKRLIGRTPVEDALKRLDTLTQEEARMASVQLLKIAHGVDDKVTGVDGRVKDVDDKVNKVINDGKEAKAVMQQTADDVDDVKRSQLRENLRRWLSPPDPSTNHNIACSVRHKAKAEWFFQGSIFKEWKSTGSVLWIHGKPGSGKSVLCSTIIQDIMALRETGMASIAYFYCDFRDADKQNRHNLLISLLVQLSARSSHCCDILSRLHLAHDSGAQKPSDEILTECLKEMLSILDGSPTYIIVDAVDECPNAFGIPTQRERILELVEELVNLHMPNLHICITSRPENDIRVIIEPVATHTVSLHNESGQKQDIIDYVRSVVYSNSEAIMRRWRKEDKDLVVDTLSARADGMFRWVFCQLEVLRHCLPPSVRRTLEELPESLDETYERVLKEIKKANRDHANRLLQCLAVAVRPLRIEELAEVLAVDFDNAGGIPKLNPDWRWDDQEQALLATCSSLIVIVNDRGHRVVQFSHFSVKEYLISDRLTTSNGDVSRYYIRLEHAHTTLAQGCLSVLLQLDDHGVDNNTLRARFPMVDYASKHWFGHAQFENVSSRIQAGMEKLFDPEKPHFAVWAQLYDSPPSLEPAAPLYYAAECGLPGLVESLLTRYPGFLHARGGSYGTALHIASLWNHVQVAQVLLEHGADINSRGTMEWSPLHVALGTSSLETAQWLLDHGADCDAPDENDNTPLHMAATNGLIAHVRMLIERNADINAQASDGWTPLHGAANNGHLDVTRLLVELGADVNARANDGSTPLYVAASFNHSDVMRLLLEHGADVDAQAKGQKNRTALHRASTWGKSQVVRVLLEHGANVDIEDADGKTASQLAAENGRLEVVELLAKHGSEHKT